MSIRVRSYLLGLLLSVIAFPIEAQMSRPFENSWFWGVKTGPLRFRTNEETRTVGTLGGDWLITRKTGGLYVSFDMANFQTQSRVEDSNAGGGFRLIDVNDLKRISAAGMFFPVKYGIFRPYAGVGMSLDLLGDAFVVTDSAAADADTPDQTFISTVDDRRSQIGLLLLGGAQAELKRFAAFAQASLEPNAGRFLIGRDPLFTIQFGLRFNVGTSIDRPH